MRNLLIALLALMALGTGGCSAVWLGILAVSPQWRDMALQETLTYSGIGLVMALTCLFPIHFLGGKTRSNAWQAMPLRRKIASFALVILGALSGAAWTTASLVLAANLSEFSALIGEFSALFFPGMLISLLCVLLLMRILNRPV